jgi:hypothetical protein
MVDAAADEEAKAPPHLNIMDMHFGKGEAVTLVVGEEEHEMLVHANYISSNSEFFKTALKQEWLEGQTRIITLPVDDPKTVTHYLYFTCSGKLSTTHMAAPVAKQSQTVNSADLARLYVLGGRLLDNFVRKAVIEELIRVSELTRIFPGQTVVSIIYGGTPEGDPARKLLVNMYANVARTSWTEAVYSPVFLFDLAQELLRKAEQEVSPKSYRNHKLLASNYWT